MLPQAWPNWPSWCGSDCGGGCQKPVRRRQLKSSVTSRPDRPGLGIRSPWLGRRATVRKRGAISFLFTCFFVGGVYGAASQAELSCRLLARARVVGGDGVCCRQVQQAAHYVLNDTIVNSLASCMTDVKGGINMLGCLVIWGKQNRASFFVLPSMKLLRVECRFLPKSEFQWTTSQRFLSPRSLFWSHCEREALLWAHFNRSRRLARWRRAEGRSAIGKHMWGLHTAALARGLLLFGNFSKQMQIVGLLF